MYTTQEIKFNFLVNCNFKISMRCVLSCFNRVRLFATLWTIAHQAPLSKGF